MKLYNYCIFLCFCKVLSEYLARKLYDLSTRSGVRNKELSICHGFRKFFTTQLIESNVKTGIQTVVAGQPYAIFAD
jgi:hypothetical protein